MIFTKDWHKEAYNMWFIKGMTFKAIGDALGKGSRTVSWALQPDERDKHRTRVKNYRRKQRLNYG